MRWIILADIHGCWMETIDLLRLIDPQPEDKIISVGDIIHKGPDEQECIRLMREVSDEYILGNHEEKQLRWERHEQKRLDTGKPNPMKNVEDYKPLSEENLKWIKNKGFLFKQITAGNNRKFLLVHAGIEPRMRSLPSTNIMQNLTKKQRYAKAVLRTRYVNPDGKMVMLGAETEEDVFWAEVYDGRFGHVIFGHQPFLGRSTPREYSHASAIDLGAVYGGYLCAYIINEDGTTSHAVVPAREKYAIHRKESGSSNPVPE